jgi:20S proteasome subunit beta 7
MIPMLDTELPVKEGPSISTSASAIMAVKYDGGILLASDKMVCYGTSLFYSDFSHFETLSSRILVGCSGELSDFQELVKVLKQVIAAQECRSEGQTCYPAEIQNYITRYLYQRRTKMNPLCVKVVLAGINRDGTTFLGVTDMYGTSWQDDIICTGMAAHIKGLQLDEAVGKDRDTVFAAMSEVWKGIYARSMMQNGPLEYFDVNAREGKIQKRGDVEVGVSWSCIEALWGRDAVA